MFDYIPLLGIRGCTDKQQGSALRHTQKFGAVFIRGCCPDNVIDARDHQFVAGQQDLIQRICAEVVLFQSRAVFQQNDAGLTADCLFVSKSQSFDG